jgi:acetolactate synthase-1/2/3 large subunit
MKTSSEIVSGAEEVARALDALGVTEIFAIASIHNIPILRAIRALGRTRIIPARHEQGAVHAADGYARANGRLGVAVVSTGPGTANAMGGLYEAAFASSPVLLLTGQIPTQHRGAGRGHIHEAERQNAMLSQVCREVFEPRGVGEVGAAVLAAGAAALSGRPQPAAVEIPIDLQTSGVEAVELTMPRLGRKAISNEDAAAVADLLEASQRPLIWAGGGVISGDASTALTEFAAAADVPVVTTREGRGAIREDHRLSLGAFPTVEPLRSFVESSDLLIAIGTKFQMHSTAGWTLNLPADMVQINVDPGDLQRTYPVSLALVGDLSDALTKLRGAVAHPTSRQTYVEEARQASHKARDIILGQAGPDYAAICASIREHLPAAGCVVRDATVPAYIWADRVLPIVTPRTSIRPTAAGIGPGLPLAIGAAVASDEPCVLIQGDGGLMLSVGELATAVQAQAPVIVCVFNDSGYGVLREIIQKEYGDPIDDVDLATPLIADLGRSFGIPSVLVSSVEQFDAAFEQAVHRRGPSLLEIDMSALVPMRR